jgi:AcrR family transcriptional regulator
MTAVKSRREEQVDATREALLESGQALFAEKGFAATSLDDVAGAARVTKGALYHHFPGGKLALFEAVFEAVDADLEQRITGAIPADAGPWEVVHSGLDAYLEACLDPVIRRIMFQEGPTALGWQRWRELDGCHSRALLRTSLDLLVQTGELRPQPLSLLTQVMFTALGEAGMAVADADDPQTARDEARRLMLDLLEGLRAG